MNPDVANAIPGLVESGMLPAEAAPRLLRVGRGELVSVYLELRALLYLGVLLITTGVGLLVKENLDRIGPAVIAAARSRPAAFSGSPCRWWPCCLSSDLPTPSDCRLPTATPGKAVVVVSLVGLYIAVHLGSFESGLVEEIGNLGRRSGPASNSELLWWLSAIATALVPAALLAIAIRTRRVPILLVGLGTAIASLVTLRYYVHFAPLWVVLTVSGALVVVVVLALRRYLDSGLDRERAGFSAEALFVDLGRQRLLEAGATVHSLSPPARPIHQEPGFTGGGGDFGGGGASSGF